jgi:hypothetical protein
MTIYTGDQPVTAPYVAGGGVAQANATVLDALAGEAATYVFSAPWVQAFNGQTLSFRPGPPYSVDAALLAALNAASAPITAA